MRGDQKFRGLQRFKILVTQSILLNFALPILTHKFNKNFKFRRDILSNEINMTFYRIEGIATRLSPPVTVRRL